MPLHCPPASEFLTAAGQKYTQSPANFLRPAWHNLRHRLPIRCQPMRQVLIAALCLCVSLVTPFHTGAVAATAKPLQIYFIDVEGGQATLVVSPSGQSLLIDAGWSGY